MSLAEGSSYPVSSLTPDQYASLFLTQPQMAPVYLRRVFPDKSPNFRDMMCGLAILLNSSVEERLNIFVHKIPDAIISLASDKALYQSRELRTDLGFRSFQYTSLLMRFLAVTITSLPDELQMRPGFLDSAERILKLAPTLFQVLWDHRKLLRYDREVREHQWAGRDYGSGQSFIEASGTCVVALTLLHKQIRSEAPPINSLQAQLLLFIWIYGPKYATGFQGDVLDALTTLAVTTDRMNIFVKDAISSTDSTKIHPDILQTRILKLLQSSQELDGRLRACFVLIQRLSGVPGTLPRIERDPFRGGGLAKSMCIACQRQLCSGDIEYDDSVLEFCLRAFQHLPPLSTLPGMASLVISRSTVLAFILVGRGLVVAAKSRDEQLYGIVAPLLIWDISPEHTSRFALIDFKERLEGICLGPWCDILAELRSLASQDRNKIAEDAIETWLTFGAFIDLTEEVAHYKLRSRQDHLVHRMRSGDFWSNSQGCCWHGCACSSFLSRHPFKVCGGCYVYTYCSKKCQKKGWKNGHRDVCEDYYATFSPEHNSNGSSDELSITDTDGSSSPDGEMGGISTNN